MRPRRRQRKGRHQNQESKPPQDRGFAIAKVQELPEPSKSEMMAVLTSMEPPFWSMMRKEQVVAIADKARGTAITQDDISVVLNVSQCSVSRYLKRHQQHPEDMYPMPGRPSPLRRVFNDINNFITPKLNPHRIFTQSINISNITTNTKFRHITNHCRFFIS